MGERGSGGGYLLDVRVAELGLLETHLNTGEGLVSEGLDPLSGLVNLGLELVREVLENIVDLLVDVVPVEVELADSLVDKAVGVPEKRVKRRSRVGLNGGGGEEQGRGGE